MLVTALSVFVVTYISHSKVACRVPMHRQYSTLGLPSVLTTVLVLKLLNEALSDVWSLGMVSDDGSALCLIMMLMHECL